MSAPAPPPAEETPRQRSGCRPIPGDWDRDGSAGSATHRAAHRPKRTAPFPRAAEIRSAGTGTGQGEGETGCTDRPSSHSPDSAAGSAWRFQHQRQFARVTPRSTDHPYTDRESLSRVDPKLTEQGSLTTECVGGDRIPERARTFVAHQHGAVGQLGSIDIPAVVRTVDPAVDIGSQLE